MNKFCPWKSTPENDLKSIGYSLGCEIGNGTYAKVYRGVKRRGSREEAENVAIKVINLKTSQTAFVEKFLPRELDVARVLEHKNIIKIILIYEGKYTHNVYMISELAQRDLLDYIQIKGPIRETLVRRLFHDLASGLEYMHSLNIVHRDIKCENCFISFDGVLKLGDFGFARTMGGDELSQTFCGSTVYAAPEILASSEPYNAFYSDVWSCGIILYAMFTAKLPFNREKLIHFFENQVVEVPQLTKKISDMATRLIRGILLFNPTDRLKLKVITEKKHEWYSPNAIHKIMEAQLHENN